MIVIRDIVVRFSISVILEVLLTYLKHRGLVEFISNAHGFVWCSELLDHNSGKGLPLYFPLKKMTVPL